MGAQANWVAESGVTHEISPTRWEISMVKKNCDSIDNGLQDFIQRLKSQACADSRRFVYLRTENPSYSVHVFTSTDRLERPFVV